MIVFKRIIVDYRKNSGYFILKKSLIKMTGNNSITP